jgi:hypothetical protein
MLAAVGVGVMVGTTKREVMAADGVGVAPPGVAAGLNANGVERAAAPLPNRPKTAGVGPVKPVGVPLFAAPVK